MKSYQCPLCDKSHTVYYGTKSPIPQRLNTHLKEDAKLKATRLSDTAYAVDKVLYLAADLKIKCAFVDDLISHRVWVLTELAAFQKQFDDLKSGTTIELEGILLSEISLFNISRGLKSKVIINPEKKSMEVLITEESSIKNDQSNPISKERMLKMMERIHHPETWKKPFEFDAPFEKRMEAICTKVIEEYIKKEKYFSINVSNYKETLFQFIANNMLIDQGENGFGLHLPNDDTNENHIDVRRAMLILRGKMDIKKEKIDGIVTYQKDYSDNISLMVVDAKKIIESVFGQDPEKCDLDVYEL